MTKKVENKVAGSGNMFESIQAEKQAAAARKVQAKREANKIAAGLVTLHNNATGYSDIPSGYKGALTVAAFHVLGLCVVKGKLVTKGKRSRSRSDIAALTTSTAASYWTKPANGLMEKGKDGLFSLTVKGLNNLSGRMDQAHAGRKLTSYGIDGIVENTPSAFREMVAFIRKGTIPKNVKGFKPAAVKVTK